MLLLLAIAGLVLPTERQNGRGRYGTGTTVAVVRAALPCNGSAMTPQELQARVLYRDGSILVIDKPAGLAVHPGPSTPESLERYLGHLRFGIREVPRLVHRLDRDTSGCLVLARHSRGASKLGRLFSSAAIKKTYWAIVEGGPTAPEGIVDRPLKKITSKDGWRMVPDSGGQRAVTRYRVLGASEGLTWLELSAETSRTH